MGRYRIQPPVMVVWKRCALPAVSSNASRQMDLCAFHRLNQAAFFSTNNFIFDFNDFIETFIRGDFSAWQQVLDLLQLPPFYASVVHVASKPLELFFLYTIQHIVPAHRSVNTIER